MLESFLEYSYNNKQGIYNNWKVSPMFENKNDLLVQEQFWDFLGGQNTYSDLLAIMKEVRDALIPEIEKKFKLL